MTNDNGKDLNEHDRNRLQQMIALSYDLFNRQNSNIHALNTRTSIILGFSLATLTFVAGLVYSTSSEEYSIGQYSTWTFHSFWILMIISILLSLCIFHPRQYHEYELYKEEDFTKLYHANESDLYDDIISVYKKIYEKNESIYQVRIGMHEWNIWIFSISCILAFVTFLLMILWGI